MVEQQYILLPLLILISNARIHFPSKEVHFLFSSYWYQTLWIQLNYNIDISLTCLYFHSPIYRCYRGFVLDLLYLCLKVCLRLLTIYINNKYSRDSTGYDSNIVVMASRRKPLFKLIFAGQYMLIFFPF